MTEQDTTAQLKAHAGEMIKQYYAYDGSNRLEYVYTAHINTGDGEPCERTQYTYDGGTTRIVKRAETNSTWDSSWDI